MDTRTLLLSPYYLPLKILRWQDAVKMRYEGTAEVLAEYEDEIASPSIVWKVPAVMRLKKMPRQRARGVRFSRANVYLRDGYRCQYCNRKCTAEELTYDHVVPRSAGGRTEWTNIVSACGGPKGCNTKKANKSCDEAGMWPLGEPSIPKALPRLGPRIDAATMPEEWTGFVRELA
jgi:5-methylcytosine-specific restriction endonuclease McrA